MIDLSISIVSYNTEDLLKKCLESIYRETKAVSFEIFVVDNKSDDGTVGMIQNNFPQVNLIVNKENIGFSAANNQAIKESSGRYFLLLNPDTVVLDSCLDKLVEFMDCHLEAGVVGPQILYPDKTFQFSYDDGISLRYFFNSLVLRHFVTLFHLLTFSLFRKHCRGLSRNYKRMQNLLEVKEVGRVRGCCFLVRRDAINEVGLMDEQFFLYCDEVDWAYRIRKAGWKIYFFSSASIIHHWAQSTKQINDSSLIIHQKSDYKYLKKHYGSYAVFLLRCMLCVGADFSTIRLLKELLFREVSLEEAKHRIKLSWKVVWIKYKD